VLQIFGRLKASSWPAEGRAPHVPKLVEGAVEYARDLGFPPHADYSKAKLMFGDIEPSSCRPAFECGKDGKLVRRPPLHDPERCERIVHALSECSARTALTLGYRRNNSHRWGSNSLSKLLDCD
jgi:hypothetical protein